MKSALMILVLLLSVGGLNSFAQQSFYELVEQGTPSEVEVAVEEGAAVNSQSSNLGSTPLMHAAWRNEDPRVIRALVEAGAQVNARDRLGRTALMFAVTYNNHYVASELIDHDAAVNTSDDLGRTPLLLAATRNGRSQVVRTLLEAGAHVNARDGESGATALIRAAMWNRNPEILETLLDFGADIGAVRFDGTTALIGAAEFNRGSEVIGILLGAGAEVNTRNANKWTPLMMAAADLHGNGLETVRLLLEAGARVNARNTYGHSALIIAARFSRNPAVLEELLDAGADPGFVDDLGRTALDHARENRDVRDSSVFERIQSMSASSRGSP